MPTTMSTFIFAINILLFPIFFTIHGILYTCAYGSGTEFIIIP